MSKHAFGTSCYIFVIIRVELASRDAAAAATATKRKQSMHRER